jgi:hypothetical protein
VTTAEAWKRAERLRGDVLDGRDPWAERRDGRAETLRAGAEARRRSEADAYTVRQMLADRDRLALAKRRAPYRRDALSRLNLHLAPIMDRPAAAVDRAAENGGATTSRRVKQCASTMFTWGAGRMDGLANPFLEVAGAGAEAPRSTGAELGRYAPPPGPVLVAPDDRLDGPPQVRVRRLAVRPDLVDQRRELTPRASVRTN